MTFGRWLGLLLWAGMGTIALPGEPDTGEQLFTLRAVEPGIVVVDWNPATTPSAEARSRGGIRATLPLRSDLEVELELEPFSVTGPDTRFVLGRKDGPDIPVDFDPSSVRLFRGRVVDRPGSHVFLALSEHQSTGYVDLGAGRERYRISSRAEGGLAVFETGSPSALPPDVPFCGVDGESGGAATPSTTPRGTESSHPIKGLKHLQLAVDTDHEFYLLFNDFTAAMSYVTAMYAEVSDIYVRDVDTWIELTFVRIWFDPNDLFNDVDPSPLGDFRDHWNANMGGVPRDTAQLLSGRRDYPFGGQAYLSGLCGSNQYSVVGYAMGFFPDPETPNPYSYDISVTAHELGHTCGTGHTHDSPNFIDTCDDALTTPQRGTIMSYCGQTWSGGNANRDLYFHSTIQQNMESLINSAGCIVDDCNRNSVDDATDVLSTSLDANMNGVPDECEDCNNNLVLDTADIGMGSLDLNFNGVPDECEPDCNSNGVPDDKDIADATSTDLYGNDVPDECEADCDLDTTSDYTQIQADMTLDVDRSTVLDACQDCDSDGTTDLVELQGGHHAWVASGLASAAMREFHPSTGVLTRLSGGGAGAAADQAQDLIVAPSGNILVSSAGDHRVMEFDSTGSYLGDLVAPMVGGLDTPTGLVVTPDGTKLLVASSGTDMVLAYDASTGASLGPAIAGAGGLSGPFGMIFGPNGNLFVTSDTHEVLEYSGQDGSFVRVFVDAAGNGGLDQPRGVAFKPDGNLLVASFGTNEVLEFNGQTGEVIGKWARVGTADRLTQISPWGVRVAPNGNVFVVRTGEAHGSGSGSSHHDEQLQAVAIHTDDDQSALHLTNAQIYEFDARNGNFLRTYIGGNDHGLEFPTGFDFVPGWQIDCNQSYMPDACDIALGFSQDTDSGGTPDECELDCDSNGIFDRLDVIPHGTALDCNLNFSPDGCDVGGGGSADCTSNGIPDECEPDCNGNGIADSCDIDAGTSFDCNRNGIPDECDPADDLETDTGWTVGAPGDTATTGVWVRVDPIGTAAQPEDDHTPGAGSICFVTGQGTVGGVAGENDVDGGVTTLTSPAFDLTGDPDVELGYWRWFSNTEGSNPGTDVMDVDISNDGGQNWTALETVGPTSGEASGGWFFHLFRVADFVAPTGDVKLRFVAGDLGGGSIVEAAVDDVVIVAECCQPPAEVAGLTLSHSATTQLDWTAQGAGVVYDVVSGDLAALRGSGSAQDASCQGDDEPSATFTDSRPDPASGQGHYYLIRSQDPCLGSYGSATSGAERLPLADCP